MNEKPQIYLAGKVGGIKFKAVEYLKDDAHFVCSDGSNHSEHLWGCAFYDFNNPDLRELVKTESLEALRRSRALLAVLDTPDSFGTVAEVTYASMLGKPVLIVLIYPRKSFKVEDGFNRFDENYMRLYDAYWFVSHLPGVFVREVGSVEEARDCAAQFVYDVTPRRAVAAPER